MADPAGSDPNETQVPDPPSKTPELPPNISQGFHPDLEPKALRRSLIVSAGASMFGASFFSVVQGTVFNFFLEDLSLRDRLPYFMGLWSVSALGMMLGAAIQERWGHRRTLFFACAGGSRIIWLLIGLIPLVKPEWLTEAKAFSWLSILTVAFYFIHALGANAWLSWMADLVPARYQGQYWSLRQVGVSAASAVARMGFGYYLEHHRNFDGYAVVFALTTVIGLIDAACFLAVEHRRPKLRPQHESVIRNWLIRMKETPYRRLCGVYLLWSAGNCVLGPTLFFFMRDHVGMGVKDIALVDTTSLIGFTAFSLLWGKFSDRHGHRGPLVVCILVQALCLLLFFVTKPGQDYLVAATVTIGAIGFCGVNLFMFPLLISYTRSNEQGREAGMAAFNAMLAVANCIAYMSTDLGLRYFLEGKAVPDRTTVYLGAITVSMVLRLCAAWLAWRLPPAASETTPGMIIVQIMTTNPFRAAISLFRYAAGREEFERHDGDADRNKDRDGRGDAGTRGR